jgi:asparagine synthase (glutamine-hydrolysing)
MATLGAISSPVDVTMGYPFLAPEVLDLTMPLPDELKTRDGDTKPVLKELAARYYPREWVMAPKLGFPTPKRAWMEGPLAPWVEEHLKPGCFSRKLLGDPTVDGLSVDKDFELIWTLVNLEEFLGLAFPGVPPAEVPVLEP